MAVVGASELSLGGEATMLCVESESEGVANAGSTNVSMEGEPTMLAVGNRET